MAAEGTGILALLQFKVLNVASLGLSNVVFVDPHGVSQRIQLRGGGISACPWDFNKDGILNFLDLGMFADPNAGAGCGIDLNAETRNYDPGLSDADIESAVAAPKGSIVTVAVVAKGVTDLDTYQVEILYGPQILEFVASSSGGSGEYPSFLESKGGAAMGFRAVKTQEGLVNVSNTLVGSDPGQAPDGSGIIAVVQFKVLEAKTTELELQNVHFLDSAQATDRIAALSGGIVN